MLLRSKRIGVFADVDLRKTVVRRILSPSIYGLSVFISGAFVAPTVSAAKFGRRGEPEQQGVRHDNALRAHVGSRLAQRFRRFDGHERTSGRYFDQQANSTDIRWTVNDTFSMKYIFGYTDYFYDRTSDVDLTSNTDAFTLYSGDQQFYVSQETEYISHELQFFNDWNDRLTTTTGLFYYKADITPTGRLLQFELEWTVHTGIQLQCEQRRRAQSHLSVFPQVNLFRARGGLLLRTEHT